MRAAALLLLSGCSLFHGDYPKEECADDMDCFRAQGEVCVEGICGPAAPVIDAAPVPDAPPMPDAAPVPDADLVDATPMVDAP